MATNDNPYAGLTIDQLLEALKSGKMGDGNVANAYTSGLAGGQDGYSGPTNTQYSVFDGKDYHPGQMNYTYDDKGNYLGSHASEKDNNLRNFMLSVVAMAGGVAALGGAGSAGAGATLGEGWAGGAAGAAGDAAGAAAGAGAGSASYLSPGEVDQTLASQVAGNGGVDGSLAETGTFNAAKDSQLASDQLGLTGTDTTSAGTVSTGGAGNTSLDTAGASSVVDGASKVGQDTIKKIITTVAGAGAGAGNGGNGNGGNGNGNGGTGTNNLDLTSILQLLAGGYGMDQQTKSANSMLDYLKSRQDMNDKMYAPGSPEFNSLWDEMSRKDAAAGRNSQYGPRSVDLAARVAQLKMDANTKMTTGIGNFMANAYNQKGNAGLNIASLIPGLLKAAGGGPITLQSLIDAVTKASNGTGGDQSPGDGVGANQDGKDTTTGGVANGTTVDSNGNNTNVSGTDAGASNSLSDGNYDGANWDAMSGQTAKDTSTGADPGMANLYNYLQQNKSGPSGTITKGFNNQGAYVQDYSKYNPGNTTGWDDTATKMWTGSPQFQSLNDLSKLESNSMTNTGKSLSMSDYTNYGNQLQSGQTTAADIAKANGWNYNDEDPTVTAQKTMAANPGQYQSYQDKLYSDMGWSKNADGSLNLGNKFG